MALQKEQDLLSAILSTVQYPLILVDREGRIEAASQVAAEIVTVSPVAIRSRCISEVAGSNGALLHDTVVQVVSSGQSLRTELQSRGRWFNVVVMPLLTETGAVSGAVIHANERITRPPEAGGVAGGSDPLWLVLDQIPHAVYWKDRQSRYLGGNRIFAEVVGLASSRAVPGITDHDIMDPSDAEAVRREDVQVMQAGESLVTVDQSLKLATGGKIIEKLKMPLRSESGEIIGILCVARDITAQRRAEDKLLTDKRTAEQASRAKTSFLAAASHDLRQPIQAIALFAKLLDRRVTEPSALNLVGLIQQSVRSLSDLLDAIIHMSKLEAGAVEPNIGPVMLGDLLGRLAGEFTAQAAEKGLDLIVVNTGLEVLSDPLLLERVLRNLISNAVRYTEQGRVLIGCRRCGATVSIEVWDTGIGIPPDQCGDIFREFHRCGDRTRNASEGFGIGLAVVNRLTGLLGHQMEVSSAPGKGSVFRLRVASARRPARSGP
ncbi:PAS domain-containing protein [Skermanella mucosa]|uniref:PAS domain-containing sensor histidine kinase n=1 Tax=Skermanella mucosa TaxID=1789672 RepID=UPI00192BCC91|nr:PAS domain-containing protein [Skermanella mucosa]UEM23119.1 PAS domain-containing protein [Skermanella mucosa]